MPSEVFVFAASAVLFLVVATLVTSVLWRWHSAPLPTSLAPLPLSLRAKRLFHG